MTLQDDDPRHGTANGYTNHHCRCRQCKDAIAAYHKPYSTAYRRRLGAKPRAEHLALVAAKCGTVSGYQRHLDRGEITCRPCRDAENAKQRERRGVAPRTIAPCGTVSAYKRHLRYAETPCRLCRDAEATYRRQLRQQRKAP